MSLPPPTRTFARPHARGRRGAARRRRGHPVLTLSLGYAQYLDVPRQRTAVENQRRPWLTAVTVAAPEAVVIG